MVQFPLHVRSLLTVKKKMREQRAFHYYGSKKKNYLEKAAEFALNRLVRNGIHCSIILHCQKLSVGVCVKKGGNRLSFRAIRGSFIAFFIKSWAR